MTDVIGFFYKSYIVFNFVNQLNINQRNINERLTRCNSGTYCNRSSIRMVFNRNNFVR